MYIYICAVKLLSGPTLIMFNVIIGPSLFFKALFVQKHYNIWASAHFLEKTKVARQNVGCYYLGQVGHLCCNKFGPDNNTYLAQLITSKHVCFAFFAFENVL